MNEWMNSNSNRMNVLIYRMNIWMNSNSNRMNVWIYRMNIIVIEWMNEWIDKWIMNEQLVNG